MSQQEEIKHLKARLNDLVGATAKIVEELAELSQTVDKIDLSPQPQEEKVIPKAENQDSAVEDQVSLAQHDVGSWKEPIKDSIEEVVEKELPKSIPTPPPLPNKRVVEAEEASKESNAVESKTAVNAPPSQVSNDWGINNPANLENFIGGNLISKLGVIIIIIGVGIGMKYAIDNGWISPTTRVVLGYLLGMGLTFFGFRLKEKYLDYSAVIFGGGLTVLYFVTYAAYTFYDLLPQVLTFILMALLTTFTVLASLNYNKMLIAIFGLVGAYAVPFLLSTGSGQFEVLFTYMVVVNTGITFLAFKRDWKELFYIAFGLTWLIFVAWFVKDFDPEDAGLSIVFSFLFFVQFYLSTLAYKLVSKEEFKALDVLIILLNSFLFYGLGYLALDQHMYGSELVGLFTILNAIVHIIFGYIIYKRGGETKQLLHFTLVLSLIFVTIAIPVQLDGNWVTILWLVQALGLFALARNKSYPVYEQFAVVLLTVGVFSLLQDYHDLYDAHFPWGRDYNMMPIFNLGFMSSMLAIGTLIGFYALNKRFPAKAGERFEDALSLFHKWGVPGALLVLAFYSVWLEIEYAHNVAYIKSLLNIPSEETKWTNELHNEDIFSFKRIYQMLYFVVFSTSLAIWNNTKLKIQEMSTLTSVFIALGIFLFLTFGLYEISELRETYLAHNESSYYPAGIWNLLIRYPMAIIAFAALLVLKRSIPEFMKSKQMSQVYGLFFHLAILWYASSELLHWMDIGGSPGNYKLVLSILWGLYAVLMVSLGIAKNRVHLRIGGISLFGATLLKLFFYDLTHLSTLSKTIVFVSLGILLLIISFLYNKYKERIEDEEVD